MVSEQATDREHRGASLLGGLTVRLALVLGGLFLLAGVAVVAHAAARLVWPDLLGDSALLSYGRTFPAGWALVLFGWLTVSFLGYAFDAVPRLTGARLAFPAAALGSVLLAAAGAGGGAALVMLGENAGGRWLEFPLLADGVLTLAYLLAALVLVATVRRGAAGHLPLPAWYLVGGVVWLFLSQLVASLPGLDGLPGELQAAFTGAAMFGMWVATAGVGVAYDVIARALPGAAFNDSLGRIGFWSLGATWAWTAGRVLQNGPTADWIETIPVVFGAALVVAVVAIAADLAGAVRGRWTEVVASPAAGFAAAGVAFLVVGVSGAFVAALRSVSAVVHFTAWESGVESAVLLGAGTLFAAAGTMSALASRRGRPWGRWWGRFAGWPIVVGAFVVVMTRWVAGVQQGAAWLAGVQSEAYTNFDAGFGNSAEPLAGPDLAQLIGLGLIAVGALGFVVRLAMLVLGRHDGAPTASGSFVVQPVGGLLRGVVAVFALAAVGAFALPAADSAADPSLLAEATRNLASNPQADLGREIYLREGCWYCHTQQVRQVRTDLGLGAVSQPGDYAYDPTGVVGARRIGPDLTHHGNREETGAADWVRLHLLDPRAFNEWSVMPSYRFLSGDDLNALAVYVSGLR